MSCELKTKVEPNGVIELAIKLFSRMLEVHERTENSVVFYEFEGSKTPKARITVTTGPDKLTVVQIEIPEPATWDIDVWGRHPRREKFFGSLETHYRAVVKGMLNPQELERCKTMSADNPLKEHERFYIGVPLTFQFYDNQQKALVKSKLAEVGKANRDLINLKGMFSIVECAALEEEREEAERRSRIEEIMKES